MKKLITFLLISAALTAIFFIAISINSPKDNGNSEAGAGEVEENQDNEITGGVVKEDSEDIDISENSVGGGGSGSSGSGSSSGSEGGGIEALPLDLYTKPCGYYFLEYGVCAGVCPDGQCLIDEKSCYCRLV